MNFSGVPERGPVGLYSPVCSQALATEIFIWLRLGIDHGLG